MLNVCYSKAYFAKTHTNSMEKLTAIAEQLKQWRCIKFHQPLMMDLNLLRRLHDEQYVNAFLSGAEGKLATSAGFKPWNSQLRDAIIAINSGQLLAAELAFKHGISANIAQGFHHAVYGYGGSFCTFNGLALVALKYQNKKIFVLDCDHHAGDGTTEFSNRLENLFNFSIYGAAGGLTSGVRSESRHIHSTRGSFAQYTLAIYEAFQKAKLWEADLMIYQAGMDCHQADPLGGSTWFSSELIEKREHLVFSLAKKNKIPLMFVLAGGYQPLEDLIPLHLKTFEIAYRIYYTKQHHDQ